MDDTNRDQHVDVAPARSQSDDQPQEPPHFFEDMSPEMIRIYLDQERQEKAEDEAFHERERVWHERYWEEFHNAVSDR